ncbi:DoxX-like family protein [Salegentibacter holothuriorum]|uniref:DoxX-like family protein n=1 Tax=Salegentibacter holothuriorum TaxID=241145 RepID=A0A1T5D803_9FLAO|nr:DoxX family protein [Salegentibacter holothuriorum]SKB67805.1 DoxX-like family protein [Salegentibacter holothuriorum]
METFKIILQLIVGLGILNVWLLRFNKKTIYRGGEAANMKGEFQAYGLPEKTVYLIGFIKITLGLMLIAGIWLENLVDPAAIGMAAMMIGAIAMHLKIKDSFKQTLPAISLLVICLVILWL